MITIHYNLKNYAKRPLKWLLFLLYSTIFYLILPVSFAVFIAYLAHPLLQLLKKALRLPYWVAALLTEAIILVAISFLALITLHSISLIFPSINIELKNWRSIESYDSFFIQLLQQKSMAIFEYLLSTISQLLQQVFEYIIESFIFIVALFFALFESRKSRTWFFIYVPPAYREEWKGYFTKGMQLFSYFFFVEFQLIVLTFLLLAGGFSLLSFDYAVSKAFLISLADSLPFLGIGLFLIPISVYFFIVGEDYLGGALLLLYVFVQLTRQLAESMLWASTLHLRTVHTFFISAASILLFGLYGILLSPFLLFFAVHLKDKMNNTQYR